MLSVRFTRLADGPVAKARVALATVALAIAEALPRSKVRPRRIPVDYGHRRYELTVGGCNDFEVLNALLLDDAYEDMRLPREPQVIVDLGSHIGASLLVFHRRYPHARLVGVEPDPAVFARLRKNADCLPDVTLRNVAVAGQNGTVAFYASRDAWASSMFPSEHAGKRIDVPVRTLRALLDDVDASHVGLLKLNIEGAEFDVITSFDDWSCVDAIVVEWHGEHLSRSSLEQVREILSEPFDLDVVPVAQRPGDYLITGRRPAAPARR